MIQIVEMHVNMDCHGCEDNVRKALNKLEGKSPGTKKISPTCLLVCYFNLFLGLSSSEGDIFGCIRVPHLLSTQPIVEHLVLQKCLY